MSTDGKFRFDGTKFKSIELAEAVQVEPVSAPGFPANRKKNREFCVFMFSKAILASDR